MAYLEYDEIIKYIEQIPQYTGLDTKFKYGYDRAELFLKRLKYPDRHMRIVHVAGSNGKGSVCKYLSDCLSAKGIKTGLFTSPHLVDIRERIRINEKMISKEDFEIFFNEVLKITEEIKKENTNFENAYFEFFFYTALLYYKSQGVEIAVIETGLGGRLDATNAIEKKELAIITDIDLEHTKILGDNIKKIAKEKAGIIKENISVVASKSDEAVVNAVISETAKEKKCRLIFTSDDTLENVRITPSSIDFSIQNSYYKNVVFSLPAPAYYEALNAQIALKAFEILNKDKLQKDDLELLQKALSTAKWEGRMERIQKNIYVDGAHNPKGIKAFIKSVKGFAGNKKNILLFSVAEDKNYEQMINIICDSNIFCKFVITKVSSVRGLSADHMADVFKAKTSKPLKVFEDTSKAFEYAKEQKKDYLFCAGSLYLAGEIKSILSEDKNDKF